MLFAAWIWVEEDLAIRGLMGRGVQVLARKPLTAILVEPEAVWPGLAHPGEWGSRSKGLLRFDRRTEAVQRIAPGDIAVKITRGERGLRWRPRWR